MAKVGGRRVYVSSKRRRPARMFALAGLLLPSASVFRLLVCNDREVLGPWINPRWPNLLAGLIVSVLLLLSGILMSTTLFPRINVMTVSEQIATAWSSSDCSPECP